MRVAHLLEYFDGVMENSDVHTAMEMLSRVTYSVVALSILMY